MTFEIKYGKKKHRPFDPQTDTGAKRPVTAVVAAGDVNDKYSDYPSEGLTPRRLARIFKQAVEGDIRAQMELFEDIEEKDPHLFSQMQTRKLAVTGLDWEIQPASDDERDKQIAEFITGQMKGLEDFPEAMLDMLDAIGKGVSILEIGWGFKDGANVIEKLEYVHPKKLMWDAQTDELLICTKDYPSGIPLPENKFVVHRYKAKSGHLSRAGVFRVVAWYYLFKNFDIKDWVSFCELFGMPMRLGKYGASASEADKEQLKQAIVQLGTDAAGIVPESTAIEFIEAQKNSSSDAYERLARYADEQVSKAVLGQTLTSDSGGGSYAQSKTHNEVRHDLTESDAKALASTIRRYILRPLVEYNFGTDAAVPLFVFDVQEAEDQKELVEVYRTLSVDMGLPIPAAHVYKKFNIPKPEPGEELLKPRVQGAGTEGLEEETAESMRKDGTAPPEDGTAGISLKEGNAPSPPQEGSAELEQVDGIVELAAKTSADIFRKMFSPILKRIDGAEDMEALVALMKDEHQLKELYREMESPELMDLLHQGIYLSTLIGRSMD